MSTIGNTAGSHNGRDGTYNSFYGQKDAFYDLFLDLEKYLQSIDLSQAKSIVYPKLEKAKPHMHRLISKWINSALLDISAQQKYASIVIEEREKIKHIMESLSLASYTSELNKAGKLKPGQGIDILGYVQDFTTLVYKIIDAINTNKIKKEAYIEQFPQVSFTYK